MVPKKHDFEPYMWYICHSYSKWLGRILKSWSKHWL